MAIAFPDPAVTNPWQDPVSFQWWQHDGDGWLRFETAFTGYKNVLINGDFRINQRNFGGDWAALVNGYGYDRWSKNSTTAIFQRIEAGNVILGQTYTLSWEGGGVGSFSTNPQDPATESPFIGIASDNNLGPHTDVTVPFAATNVQLELGSVPTAFELRPIGLELLLCQRYYVKTTTNSAESLTVGRSGTALYEGVRYPTTMQASPIVRLFSTDNDAGDRVFNLDTVQNMTVTGVNGGASGIRNLSLNAAPVVGDRILYYYEADAEL